MKRVISILIFLSSILAISQKKKETFPNSFLGKYSGTLEIFSKKGTQKIPMEFHLTKAEKDSTYNYTIVYNKSPRNYFLKIVDVEKGIYQIDENNGIILPASFHKNVLHSIFEVQGNILSTRLAFNLNQVEFEILFSRLESKTITGGTSKEIPKVFGYPINVFQKATLSKKN